MLHNVLSMEVEQNKRMRGCLLLFQKGFCIWFTDWLRDRYMTNQKRCLIWCVLHQKLVSWEFQLSFVLPWQHRRLMASHILRRIRRSVKQRKNYILGPWRHEGPKKKVENIILWLSASTNSDIALYIFAKGKKDANLHHSPNRIASCTQKLVFKVKIQRGRGPVGVLGSDPL